MAATLPKNVQMFISSDGFVLLRGRDSKGNLAARKLAAPHDIGFVGLGASPLWTRAETPVMPKGRYKIMANYMPKVGTMGLDMMFRT